MFYVREGQEIETAANALLHFSRISRVMFWNGAESSHRPRQFLVGKLLACKQKSSTLPNRGTG